MSRHLGWAKALPIKWGYVCMCVSYGLGVANYISQYQICQFCYVRLGYVLFPDVYQLG